jgi:tetratricopeptide (TPR) repeat protein
LSTAPFAGTTGDAAAVDPLSGTPREQADRLFNRIMTEKSNGNTDQAVFFTPMALQAYQMAEPLDIDGLYHVSLIKAVASDFTGAEETARQILDAVPTHLLGLAALAEAALGAGDTATAKEAYGKFLDNLAAERARQLQEYQDHAAIIATYEQDAHSLLGR